MPPISIQKALGNGLDSPNGEPFSTTGHKTIVSQRTSRTINPQTETLPSVEQTDPEFFNYLPLTAVAYVLVVIITLYLIYYYMGEGKDAQTKPTVKPGVLKIEKTQEERDNETPSSVPSSLNADLPKQLLAEKAASAEKTS
ncbi:hypothetical protein RB195_010586 [Necator americanus]|uniref:Resistance to inhibitors of cholinesterase protein 3 N-terminal domain-containing protein n=1 Tax=Necator americanus TaxID=51031 RepID=A0ABR1CYM5_NECAM